jgi:large subunit ribosomal protein L20
MTYSKLIAGLKKADIRLNRKMLAEMALRDTASFKKIVSLAKA